MMRGEPFRVRGDFFRMLGNSFRMLGKIFSMLGMPFICSNIIMPARKTSQSNPSGLHRSVEKECSPEKLHPVRMHP
jgi:hypothetical protein